MDDDKKLHEVLRLERENNALLRKLLAIHRRSLIYKVVYWVIIIGAAIGIFSFLKPYLDLATSLGAKSTNGVSGFLESFQGASQRTKTE